ncbi:YaaC family protein [Pseudomonas sp. YY-1]|uniref:YaaC family protein n=1 Tax=Pseudomonas sp. YY-1 TaxID=2058659 RepID=UPI0012FEA0E2|nr:YaaC family protein [Pseudomonas sp. YY-1]
MALQEVKEAKYKYQNVRYSHILMEPAEPAILTADPWSFMHGHLLERVDKSAGNNRTCFKRARYFASLAENFYKAAKSVEMPAKGTLYYYGMMNLVKALLSVNKVNLEDVVEHHGITNTHGKRHALTISGKISNCTNIFLEFSKILGTPVVGKHEITLRHVCTFIPELSGISRNLGFFKDPKYLPINIRFCVNESSTYLMTEVEYSKGLEASLDTSKFLKRNRKDYFLDPYEKDSKIIHRSAKRKRVNNQNWPAIYKNILKEYSTLGIASILTRNGYRYYCSLQEGSYHHLCNSYLLMFYLGHSARYRPSEIEEIMQGELRPMATEAVAILPKQFMYQLVSLITGKLCVIPFSEI